MGLDHIASHAYVITIAVFTSVDKSALVKLRLFCRQTRYFFVVTSVSMTYYTGEIHNLQEA